jgi:hypothetical protein
LTVTTDDQRRSLYSIYIITSPVLLSHNIIRIKIIYEVPLYFHF